MNNRKVVTSAIIVSPPKETWGPIQDIRLKFDKAYKRWMPHINLIYPFYPAAQFASVLPALQEGLAGVAPFTVRFDKFDYFEHGASSCTLFLHPTVQPPNALRDLQAALERVFPDCTDQSSKSTDGFHAHLTVGQFRGKAMTERKKAELMQSWKPIEWRVDHVQLISRNSTDPFEVLHTVPLGSGSSASRQQQRPQQAQQQQAQQQQQQQQPRQPRPQLAPNAAAKRGGPAQPGEAEAIVLDRLAQWIAQIGASARASNLPKTRAKLRTAIRPMCAVKVQYVDVDEALRQLREENLVCVVGAESPTAKVTFPKKREQRSGDERQSTNAYIASDTYRLANEARKDPVKLVMARCREWVESPLNTPTTLDALRNSLRQLCIMKEEVEPEQAVKLLEARNVISVDYDDKVTYA